MKWLYLSINKNCCQLDLTLIFSAIPKEIITAHKLLPPAESKGKGMPVTGEMPIFMPILINICTKIMPKKPKIK